MNVNLTPHFESLIRDKVASGQYGSASEVIREALRLFEEQDKMRGYKLEQLRQAIQEGIDSGESTPWNTDDLLQEARNRRNSTSTPQT